MKKTSLTLCSLALGTAMVGCRAPQAQQPQVSSQKPVYVLCRFDLKKDADKAAYRAETEAVAKLVRAEKGCLKYTLLGDVQTTWEKPQRFGADTYWMLEEWESEEALKAHLEMPHMKNFGPKVRPMRAASTFHVLEEVIK